MKYALIDKSTHKVVNCIEWDGKTNYTHEEGYYLVCSEECEIGHDYKDGCFVDNRPKPDIIPYVDPQSKEKAALREKLKAMGFSDEEIDLLKRL